MVSIRLGLEAARTDGANQTLAPASPAMSLTPKTSILAMSAGAAAGTIANPYNFDLGATDGALKRAIALLSRNGAVAALTTQGGRYDTASVIQHTTTTTNGRDGNAGHSSFGAGQHVITWPDTLTTANLILYVLMGGSDVSFEMVDFASHGTAGTGTADATLSTVTDPNFVMVFGRGNAAFASETGFTARSFSVGIAVKNAAGGIEQWCLSDVGANNATSARTVLRSNRCAQRLTAGGDQGAIQLTTWLSNGARFTTQDVSEVTSWTMLFGKFTRNKLRAIAGLITAGSTGNKPIAVGSPTKAYCMIGTDLGAVDTSSTGADASKWSYGWVDEESAVACLGAEMEPAAATGDSRSIARNDHIVDVLDDAGAHSWSATPVTKNTNDVVINVDDNAGGNRAIALFTVSEDQTAIDETVELSDEAVRERGRAVTEDEELVDEAVRMRARAVTEDVELIDEALRARGRAVTEDVELVDEANRARGRAVTEDEEIGDELKMLRGAAVTEDVEVGDEILMQRGAQVTEDVELEDAALLSRGRDVTEDEELIDEALAAHGRAITDDVEIEDEAVYVTVSGDAATAMVIWEYLIGPANAGRTLETILAMFLRRGETVENLDDTKTVTIFDADDTTPLTEVDVSADGFERDLVTYPTSPPAGGTPEQLSLAAAVWAHPIFDGLPAGVVLNAVLAIFLRDAEVVENLDGSRTVTIYDLAGTTPVYQLEISADGLLRTRTL